MRVAIDYTAAVRQGGGIGRYTRNLIRALSELDSESQYTLFVAGRWGRGDGLGPWPGNFRLRSVPLTDRMMNIIWQRIRVPLPVQAFTGRIDLFHSPDFVLPAVGRTPAVLTVHDLSFLRVPHCFVPGFREYLEAAVARGIRRAVHILADSENTRLDLVELLGVKPDRITVVYPGVEARFTPTQDDGALDRVRRLYRLPERFVLGLGTLQPRKNFEGLIQAFGQLLASASGRKELADLHLVIGGGQGWLSEGLGDCAARHGLSGRVHFPGYVRDEDLPAFYSLASVFAFPSLYEGFGLPVLEAMACGTPVVAANNSSLPEVVGEAGLLVDAASTEQLAHALLTMLTDSDLAADFTSRGCTQAAKFTWPQAATSLQHIYAQSAAVA